MTGGKGKERRNLERLEEKQRKEKPGGIKCDEKTVEGETSRGTSETRKSAVRSEERKRKERPRETTSRKAEKGKTQRGLKKRVGREKPRVK
jgi:hypothetical protein